MTWDYTREDKQSVKLRLALQEGQLLFCLEDILEGVCDSELPHCRVTAFAKNLVQVGNRGYFDQVGRESERGAIRRLGVRKGGDFRHLRRPAETGFHEIGARKRGYFWHFFPPANTEERDAFSGRFSAVGYPRDDAGIRPRANSLPVDKRPGIFALDSKYRQYSPRMSQK